MAQLRERLDAEHRLTDDTHGDVMLRRRRQAVERLVSLDVERPPDPGELSKILDEAHKPCGIHWPA